LTIDVTTRRPPNLALAGWAWERHDYPKAVELYWRAAELEAIEPTLDQENDADFVFDTLVGIELFNKRPDRAARALRLKAVRVLTLDDPAVMEASERFGMHVR